MDTDQVAAMAAVDPKRLTQLRGWLRWTEFKAILEGLVAAAGHDEMMDIFAELAESPGWPSFQRLMKQLGHPRFVYRAGARWAAPTVMPVLKARFEELADDEMLITLALKDGCDDYPFFFESTGRSFAKFATMVGYPPADVTIEKNDGVYRFSIKLEVPTKARGVKNALLTVVAKAVQPLFSEIERQQSELLMHYGELELAYEQQAKKNRELERVNSELERQRKLSDDRMQQLEASRAELAAREDELRKGRLFDNLTGLANRTLFTTRLGVALERLSEREVDVPVAVLFVDLDRFGIVNESFGHACGDELLLQVADRLQGVLRPRDTAARLGADEFTVLLEEAGSTEQVALIAERIRDAVNGEYLLRSGSVYVYASASVGIALGERGAAPDEVLRDASTAAHRAKGGGRGRVELFDVAHRQWAVERVQMEAELRRAIERWEFVVHYQPIMSLATGRVTSVEALLRWAHPEHGLLSPARFIPLAEDTGLIVEMTESIVRQSCAVLRESAMDSDPPVRVSVNLSERQIRQDACVEAISRVIASEQVDAARLSFEVTESVYMHKNSASVANLHRLKQLGVSLQIDDFGTGYSSFSYLTRLPVDTLKIDRSFVEGMVRSPTDLTVVRSVVELAHNMGLMVVAEGVEDEDQLRHLRQLGCDFVQGYLIAKPVPQSELSRAMTIPPGPLLP